MKDEKYNEFVSINCRVKYGKVYLHIEQDYKDDRMYWPKNICICEVGPRDGLQIEKVLLTIKQKVELIARLVKAGAKEIEIGSFVSPLAVPQMADTDEVAKLLDRNNDVKYIALITNLRGLNRAKEVGIRHVRLVVSASRSHSFNNLNRAPEELLKEFPVIAENAANEGIIISGAISTTFGCPYEGKIPFEQILKIISSFYTINVKEISLSDTTGMAVPKQVYDYCQMVKKDFSEVVLSLHFHNTRGTGFANVIAGMQAGIDRFDSSIAGLGGCPFAPGASGNIATEDLVHMCNEMNINTGYNLDDLVRIGKDIQTMIGHETSSFILKAGKSSYINLS